MKQKLFLGITFILCWGIELGLILTGHVDDKVYDLMIPLVMLAPALVVLITKLTIKEPLGMNLWFKPQGRKTLLYIIIGWFAPVLLIALGTAFYFLLKPGMFDAKMAAYIADLRAETTDGLKEYTDASIRGILKQEIVINIIMAPLSNILICLPEEFAWRGYYLNMLCEKHPRWRAVLINGAVWGLWYLPLVIGMGLFYGKEYTGYPVLGCIGALLYCIVTGCCYSFLTLKTQTCIPAAFASSIVASIGTVGILFTKHPGKLHAFISYYPNALPGGIGFLIAAAVIFYFLYKDKIQPAPAREKALTQQISGSKEAEHQGKSLRSHLDNPNLPKKH